MEYHKLDLHFHRDLYTAVDQGSNGDRIVQVSHIYYTALDKHLFRVVARGRRVPFLVDYVSQERFQSILDSKEFKCKSLDGVDDPFNSYLAESTKV